MKERRAYLSKEEDHHKFLLEDEATFQRIGYFKGLDSFDAQDWAQDVRLHCWLNTGKLPSFKFAELDAYTYTRLLWSGGSAGRKKRRRLPLLKVREGESLESFAEERLPIQFSVEEETVLNEQFALGLRLLGEGLLSLSFDLRDAWILREIVELDYPEVAKILGLKRRNTAYQRHSRADRKLTAFLKKHQCTVFPCDIALFLLDLQEETVENTD